MSIYILAVIYYSYITFLPYRFHSESTVLLAWVASWFCRYSFSSGKFLFEDSYSDSNTLLRWCCLIPEQYRTSHCFCWRCALKSIIARHGLEVPRSPLHLAEANAWSICIPQRSPLYKHTSQQHIGLSQFCTTALSH